MRDNSNPRQFTSLWAIPRVDPQEQPKPAEKRMQVNNLALLFVIYVFKKIKKPFLRRKQARNR
jgi:hypothetical protein